MTTENYKEAYADIKLTWAERDKYLKMMKSRLSLGNSATLSEFHTEKALFEARERKYYDEVETAKYWEKVKNLDKTIPTFTNDEVKAQILLKFSNTQGKELIFDEHNLEEKRIFDLLVRYFNADETLEQEGISLKKGLLLQGPYGCGKTTFMQLFEVNSVASYAVKYCPKIAEAYASTDKLVRQDIIEYNSRILEIPSNTNIFRQTTKGICFDDLGKEDIKGKWGNVTNVIREILRNRYQSVPFNYTHITTNLTVNDIGERYGGDLRSRLSEMFNQIKFPATCIDRRRWKPEPEKNEENK